MIIVGGKVTVIGGMSRRGAVVTVEQISEGNCTIIDAAGNKGIYALTDLEPYQVQDNGHPWVLLHVAQFSRTEAIPMANGCMVRVSECVDDIATESSVFVPNSIIVNGKVEARPTRMQVSEKQFVVVSELAAISMRTNELVLILRCGKEISVTEDVHTVLDKILRES